ncbi:hypothetical protein K458DRAFT_417086 [Lentithecium fluviatile CBS 122367]|uniref:BYS1 domain protein n=1 Tax=Lentithecium fluviatile CBS 122367 TaxID=1168545 RepID=A0A6G1J5U0_9PLEO|nr:hypothetical protein K458DRAFT_417086 [Lentithecium fluviatile CBS 122367]
MRFTIITLATLASSAAAVGNAIIKNNCPQTIYAWSVGGDIGPKQTIGTGKQYSEQLHRDPKSGGIALKMTKVNDGLWTGAPEQIFSYSLDGALVWYDLSTVFGEPFSGQHIKVTSEGGPTIDWPKGTNPGGSQVKVGNSEKNVVFTACA